MNTSIIYNNNGKFPISTIYDTSSLNIAYQDCRSCHHCREHIINTHVTYCKSISDSNKKCRKQFCHQCLRLYYSQAEFQLAGDRCIININDELENLFSKAEKILKEKLRTISFPDTQSKNQTILTEFLDYCATNKEINESILLKDWECPCCLEICQCPACRSQRKPRVDLEKENEGCPNERIVDSTFIDNKTYNKSDKHALLGWNFGVRSPTLAFKKINASYYSSKMGFGRRNSWPFNNKVKQSATLPLSPGVLMPNPISLTPKISPFQPNKYIKIPNFCMLSNSSNLEENEIGGISLVENKLSFSREGSLFTSRSTSICSTGSPMICSDF